MLTVRHLMVVLLAGSIWGMVEALGGGFLYARGIGGASILLSTAGLAVLALARFLTPVAGTSLAVVGVALVYRWLNVGYFPCHLGGIFCFGAVFEILASGLGSARLRRRAYQMLLGGGTGVLAFAVFAGVMTWGVKDAFWAGHMDKVARHLMSGLVVGLAGAGLTPLLAVAGRRLDPRLEKAVRARPLASLGLGAAALLVFWFGL